MPTFPSNKKCEHLGCKLPRSRLNSFCIEQHGGIDQLDARQSDGPYQTAAWRSVRARQLSIQPLCQGCLARSLVVAAVHCDHVFPWKRMGAGAFTRNVFQSLCKPCHSHKTNLERQGKFEHYLPTGTKTYSKHDFAFIVNQVANEGIGEAVE